LEVAQKHLSSNIPGLLPSSDPSDISLEILNKYQRNIIQPKPTQFVQGVYFLKMSENIKLDLFYSTSYNVLKIMTEYKSIYIYSVNIIITMSY